MGVTINTNIASLMVQLSLKQASADLDSSLQQLTTGYRINSAKDDAAGYTISQNILFKLSSYTVAQNNTSMGLSMINTATGSLDLISNNLGRLRNLVVQVRNGTYGQDSINAMNKEAENLVLEMERIRKSTEYNGIKIFDDKTGSSQPATTEKRQVGVSKSSDSKIMVTTNINATESDKLGKFVNFSGGSKTVNIKNKYNTVVTSLSFNANTTVAEMQQKLKDNGINSVVSGGVITLMSTEGNYVEDASSNGVMSQMGISVLDGGTGTKKTGATNTSTSALTITTERFAVGGDKLGDVISLSSSQTINVYDSSNNITATKTFGSNNTINEVLSFLNSSNLTASINNGVISITSADGHYVKDSSADGILSKLGIATDKTDGIIESNTAITRRVQGYATVNTALADIQYCGTIAIKNSSGQKVASRYFYGAETIQDLMDYFNDNGITTTFDDATHQLKFSSTSGNYATASLDNNLNGIAPSNVCLSEAGTIGNGGVYYLSSVKDIQALSKISSGGLKSSYTFILTNDIDMSGVTDLSFGLSCDYANVTFYGNGHVIKNFSSSGPLINTAANLYLYDLGMENTSSVMVNKATGGEIINCYTTGSVNAAGGLVNSISEMTVSNCYSTCDVTSIDKWGVGGLIGSSYKSTITNCYATGNVKGAGNIGGFIGTSGLDTTIKNCFATGNVSGTAQVIGGFVGYANGNTISSSYATGDVTTTATGRTETGGFGGSLISTIFDNCYASGNAVGGFSFVVRDSNLSNCLALGNSGTFASMYEGSSTFTNCKFNGTNSDSNGPIPSTGLTAPFVYSTVTGFMTGVTHSKSADGIPTMCSSSATLIATSNLTAKESTTIDASGNITVIKNGVTSSISIASSDTFADLISKLNNIGFTASLTDGKLKIEGSTSNLYIKSIDSALEKALNLSGPYQPNLTFNTPSKVQKVKTSSTATESTKLSELGLSSNMTINTVSNGVSAPITIAPATTLAELIQQLNNIGFTASLNSGRLTITGSDSAYIETMDSALENILKLSGPYYTTSTITLKTNSVSKKLTYTDSVMIDANTTLAELGITSNQNVIINQNKSDKTISLAQTDTLATVLSKFSSAGITGFVSDGKFNINASETSYIKTMPSPLQTALKLSGAFSEEKTITIPEFGTVTNGHIINLQVGIDSSPESVISFDTSFSLANLAIILANGITADGILETIDDMIATVTAKQTMLGAVANRLDSVLDSLNINYMNQIASLSTIRDADIAQVSSKYIRSMILKQASASLLTTANQAPSIALTLIRGFRR